ncbi:MAG TPA: hypothetical protein VEW03_13465 [Longimicrobiaceae bacterium]|nr:hypothetical protein [Longimicrobiaceae bacterium]
MSGEHAGGPGPRKEVGDAESSQRHPPHSDVNARGAPLQQDTRAPGDVPTLGANAHGHDKQSTDQPPIDPESMYDHRPAEDKDRAPTDMP